MTTNNLEDKKCLKKLSLHLKANSSEEKQLQDGTKVPSMKVDLMVIVIFVLTFLVRIWIVDSMEEEVITKLDVGHVTKMDILFLPVTH